MSANYRRLISYIYAYEGGVKGNNVGFAKLETRNGQCRIQVSVRRVYVGNQEIGVYLLSGSQELLLGHIFVRNGAGEFRTVIPANKIAETELTIEQCYGLTVHSVGDSWQSYTTIWEDAVAHTAEVELAETVSERLEEQEILQVPDSHVPEQTSEEADKEEEVLPISEQIEEELEVSQTDSEEWDQACRSQLAMLDAKEPEEELEVNKLWNYFIRTYPKIQAFDYQDGCEILTVKPQDIGLLPREMWMYGNNSFLLHGYYNHRYLILARLHNPNGASRFLLGVPGHYYSNEKYMAAMFGFPHFVLSKMQPSGDGRFGYWYTDIRLGNEKMPVANSSGSGILDMDTTK